MIVAEHVPAKKTGETVVDPSHLEAIWKLSLENTSAPPPRWQLTSSQQVIATPALHAALPGFDTSNLSLDPLQ